MTILYVEDDADDQQLFREAISTIKPEAKVQVASDIGEAVNFLHRSMPHVVFVDYNLKGLTQGKDFLMQLRKDSKFDSLPIFIYSTSTSLQNKYDCLMNGATEYLVKPSSFPDICALLNKTLRKYLSAN